MEREYVEENRRQSQRLRDLVDHISDAELNLPAGAGWTVATILAHLAVWDNRAAALVKRWQSSGQVEPSYIDVDAINDAVLPLCLALPPRAAAALALAAAEAIDHLLEEASDDLIQAIRQTKDTIRVDRGAHRREHLDQIEAILKSS
jgi:Mycothiol maleylpyruvate isomerase N-terminal domain